MSVVVKLALGTPSNLFFHWFGLVAFYFFMFFVAFFMFVFRFFLFSGWLAWGWESG